MRTGTAVLVFALVVGAAAGAAWFALRGGPGAGDATGGGAAPGASAAGDGSDAAPGSSRGEHRARAKGPGAWRKQGEGVVVGVVREHGTDRGLADVPVELSAGADGPDATHKVTTAADGSFRFERVADFGGWTFRARVAEPRVDVEQSGVAVLADRTTDLGTVWAVAPAALAGVVVDAQGAPVEGAEVRVLRTFRLDRLRGMADAATSFFDPPVPVDTTRSGADGRFRLLRTPPGAFDVTADKEGLARGVERVSLVPGAAPRDVRFTLQPGHALTGRVVRSGAATADAAGGNAAVAGVEGVRIRATPQEGFGMAPWLLLPRVVVAESDAAGAFRLGGLAPGKWTLVAVAAGEMSSKEVETEVPGTAPVEITLGGDAHIEGRVTGPGDAPVAGARVFVSDAGKGQRFVTAVTGDDGTYRAGGMTQGSKAHVFAEARGFASSVDFRALMRDEAASVTLVPGRNVFDIRLAAGGALTGRVVSKGDAKPLPGVRVTVRAGGPAGLFGGQEALTSADGRFEVRGLPVGRLSIHLEKTGWHMPGEDSGKNPLARLMEMGREEKEDEAGPDPGTGLTIVTAEGATVERSLEMEPAVVVTGRVTGPDGAGIPAARVKIQRAASREDAMAAMLGGLLGNADEDVRVTGAAGEFELTAPPGAAFSVSAEAEGFVGAKSDEQTGASGARIDGVTIALAPGATIEGTVTGPEGGPVAGVEIAWKRAASLDDPTSFFGGLAEKLGPKAPPAATTSADGTWRVRGIPAGKMSVTFRCTGFRELSRQQSVAKDAATLRLDVTLDRGAVVTGRVVDDGGNAVAGAQVTCSPKPAIEDSADPVKDFEMRIDSSSDDEDGSAVSAADGAFRIEGLAPGVHLVRAKAKGLHSTPAIEATGGGDPVTVRVVHGLAIAGVVRSGGKPVAGARLSASRQRGPDEEAGFDEVEIDPEEWDRGSIPGAHTATSRDDGTFEFPSLAPGKYRVAAGPHRPKAIDVGRGGGGATRGAVAADIVRTTVKDVAAGSQGVVIDCAAGFAIAGTVTLADGSKPEEGSVSVERVLSEAEEDAADEAADEDALIDEDEWDLSDVELEDGAFRIPGLAAGTYLVTVEVPGAAKAHVEVAAGKTDVQIRLRPSGGVAGRIVMPGGKSAGRVWFHLRRDGAKPDEPEESEFERTDRSGKIALEGVAEGAWTLVVEDHVAGGRQWTASVAVVVRAGETTKLADVTLRDAGPAPKDEEEDE